MNGSFNYKLLSVQYGGFMVPAMQVKVNHIDLIKILKVQVSELNIELGTEEASSASFTIENTFQAESRSFLKKVSSILKLGAVVSVELGYGSIYTKVFKGFVMEINYGFQDFPVIQVTAMDVVRLMMTNHKQNLKYENKTYSEIVKEVLQKYKTVCSNVKNIETTVEKKKITTQNGTDYSFLKKLAKLADKEFFTFAGAAYFRTPEKNQRAILTLEWGKNLMSFQKRVVYCYEKIIVQGIDKEKHVMVEATKIVKTENIIPVMTLPLESITQKADLDNESKANKMASSLKRKKKQTIVGGSGSCIGLPELVPGRFIYISGLEGNKKEKFYLKSVKHSFGSDGFSTSFTTGR